MLKRILIMALLLCMVFPLLAACGSDEITAEKAEKIVLKELGVSAEEAKLHVHLSEFDGMPCYQVFATVNGKTWEYLLSYTGEILSVSESNHSH